MGEIKSTLDLVLERTRNMVQTEEEKAEARARELESKVQGLMAGIEDSRLRAEELTRKLAQENDPETRATLKSVLAERLFKSLDLDKKPEVFKALAELTGQDLTAEEGRWEMLVQEWNAGKSALRESAERRLASDLAEQGISGSSVRPNVEVDQLFICEFERLTLDFEGRFKELKDALARTAGPDRARL